MSVPGPFQEHERLVLRAEGELLRVVGVVEPERDDRTRFARRQPDDVALGHDAAVGEAQARRVRDRLVDAPP